MNWDTRFASIVKETEQSLARVKSQLQTPLTKGRSGGKFQSYSSLINSPMSSKPGILKPSPGKLSPTDTAQRRRSVSFDLASPSKEGGGAIISLLTTRLKDQQKEILDLHVSISSLQRSVDQQHKQLQSLQTEVKRLQISRSTNTSVHDSQFQQFKQEVRKELSDLRSKLIASRVHGTTSPSSDYSVQSVAHELHSSKRLLRGDIDTLQEDLSTLKSKLRSHESNVGTCSSGVREVERRQDRLEKVLSQVEEWQRTEEAGRTRHTSSLLECSSQLQGVRQLMIEIQSRLVSLENKSTPESHDSTLLRCDLDPPSQATKTFTHSTSSSSPFSKSLGTRSHSSGSRTLYSTKGSGNKDMSSSHGLSSLRGSGESPLSRPSTARFNPLHSSFLWGQSSRGNLSSDDEDTLNEVSVLSSESGGLDHDLSCDLDLSPSTSLLSIGTL